MGNVGNKGHSKEQNNSIKNSYLQWALHREPERAINVLTLDRVCLFLHYNGECHTRYTYDTINKFDTKSIRLNVCHRKQFMSERSDHLDGNIHVHLDEYHLDRRRI